jgi:hypothetical protein
MGSTLAQHHFVAGGRARQTAGQQLRVADQQGRIVRQRRGEKRDPTPTVGCLLVEHSHDVIAADVHCFRTGHRRHL